MSSTYEGDPTNYPTSVTVPEETDTPRAAAFDPALEGALDRTASLRADLPFNVANWLPPTSPPSLSLDAAIRAAFYVEAKNEWWLVGTVRASRVSTNEGRSWTTTDAITVGTGFEELIGGAGDAAGNLVVAIYDTTEVFEFNRSTSTWTKRTVAGPYGGFTSNCVVYEPKNARWIYAATYAGTVYALQSTDRATWNGGDVASGVYIDPISMDVNPSSGRTIIAGKGAQNAVTLLVSDNGGIDWTSRVVGTTALASVTDAHLTYSADRSKWMLILASSTTPAAEVWVSEDDGESWACVRTLAHASLSRAACAGGDGKWCSVAAEGSEHWIVYSTDDGRGWRSTGVSFASEIPRGMYSGGGGFAFVTPLFFYRSLRGGWPSTGVLA